LGSDPIESILTAIWITLRDFKKEAERQHQLAHELIRKITIGSDLFKHDCEGETPVERHNAARDYLHKLLGGIDQWLQDYISLDFSSSDDDESKVAVNSDMLSHKMNFSYSSIAEPRLEFTVQILAEDSLIIKRRFAVRLPETSPFRIANELFQWVTNELRNVERYLLPVFFTSYFAELMLTKDDEETQRVLLHNVLNEDKKVVDILEPAVTQTLGKEIPEHVEVLKKLAITYGAFIQDAAQNGIWDAFLHCWDDLRLAYSDAFDDYLGTGSNIDIEYSALLLRAFLILEPKAAASGDRWIWGKFEPSAVITVLHPTLLEMLQARTTYLFDCFNVEVKKQLCATGTHYFKDDLWEGYLSLATIKMPLFGMLKDANLVLDTNIRGENILHRIGGDDFSEASLSTRLLLRYDDFTNSEVSDAMMFRETKESLLFYRVMKDFWKIHPHAQDGLTIAVYQNQDIQPLIAAVDKFLSDDERINICGNKPYFMSVTLFTESSDDVSIRHWLEQWKERWEAAEIQDSLSYYRQCRLSISHRIITPEHYYRQFRKLIADNLEVDIVFMNNFINAGDQGNDFFRVSSAYDVTSRSVKFPILEKLFCSINDDMNSQKRFRVLSNRQFILAAKHAEILARLKGDASAHHVVLGRGDFTPWREVIDVLHEHAEWIVCIDSSIDERLLREGKDGRIREIIGFGSGVGSHGEDNYTISTNQFSYSDLQHKLRASITEIFTDWSLDACGNAAKTAIKYAGKLSGISLIRATGRGEHIRDVLAYSLTRKLLRVDERFFCNQIISLDAYRHWFDGAEIKMRPDLLWITAKLTAEGRLALDLYLIECKLAKHSILHLDKAHQQLESGLHHLVGVFLPRQPDVETVRPDARYWWLQLHRLLASSSQIPRNKQKVIMEALERLAEGDYSITWRAAAFTYWTDDSSDVIKRNNFWNYRFKNKLLEIIPVSIGSG
ncbi:MAG: hypothetical protein J7M01_04100, partial [Candidatus Marinimicrobia bacterium]|nr:hypothetical protein [Candidatus Neomarinimicrobiota bacterium]